MDLAVGKSNLLIFKWEDNDITRGPFVLRSIGFIVTVTRNFIYHARLLNRCKSRGLSFQRIF